MQAKNTTLLFRDVQNGIVQCYGENPGVKVPFLRAVKTARHSGISVTFVCVAFREGYPEVSANNKMFSAIAGNAGMTFSDASTQIHNSVAPRPDEPVVTKFRVSAFAGSDLEVILRSRKINTLVLTGISTSRVADKDYRLVVLSDACLDADTEVHSVLINKTFPRQADVLTVDEWVETLR